MNIINDLIVHARNDLMLQSLLNIIKEKKCKIICDIGANIGMHTINYATYNPESTIYAFEPAKDNLDLLLQNIEKFNLTNINVISKALSNKVGQENVHVNWENSGDTRIYGSSDFRPSDIYEVQTTTLDEIFKDSEQLDFIKIDTQGCEPEIIEGGKEVIKKFKPIIFLEFWPWGYNQRGASVDSILETIDECKYKIKKYHLGSDLVEEVDKNHILDFYNNTQNTNTHENLLLY